MTAVYLHAEFARGDGTTAGVVTWLQITDPSNMARDNHKFGLYKVLAVVGGLTDVVIFSALIAFLTTVLEQAIENLKKDRRNTRVVTACCAPLALRIPPDRWPAGRG